MEQIVLSELCSLSGFGDLNFYSILCHKLHLVQ